MNEVVNKDSTQYKAYYAPYKTQLSSTEESKSKMVAKNQDNKQKPRNRKHKSKWLKGWRLAVIICSFILMVGLIVALLAFPSLRQSAAIVIDIIIGWPFMLIMLIAYADDMFARR